MSAKTDLFKIDFEIGHLDGFSLADLSIFADNVLFTALLHKDLKGKAPLN